MSDSKDLSKPALRRLLKEMTEERDHWRDKATSNAPVYIDRYVDNPAHIETIKELQAKLCQSQ